ncbi:DNA polymerase III subunit beta [Streptobacillus felis]|uniref:DNA polymerase III subunit beta n=1 Tax=Streptobacillus felis TaxID=1384509 RepID=A0A7Z0PH10_9FUSO|nr:DNA polymerase III subunit beta [Streptobacillus felis]NYV28095.1 DNA polymerase III subunit beta [Streptobacillus felis]
MLNIRLNRREFLKKIQIVENAIVDDKANGINSGIFIETLDDKLLLKGMGEGLYIKAEMPCEVIEKGEFIIKHKLMEEFLKQLDQDFIEIKEVNGKIAISSGKSSSEFSIYEFEKRNDPYITNGLEFTFKREELLSDIERVKFAASINLDRLAVNCIRFEIDNTGIKFVSSDAHRLIFLNKVFEEKANLETLSISIPLRSINSLIKIMKIIEDETLIFKSEGTRILFKFKDVEILTKLVEIQYPDYKTLLNSIRNNKKALLNIKDLISILRRVFVFVKDNNDKKDVAIFNFKNNQLEVSGSNDLAISNEKINCIYEGDSLKIALNVKYILDYLTTISDSSIVEMKMYDERTPVLLNVENSKESIYLVAPTQI